MGWSSGKETYIFILLALLLTIDPLTYLQLCPSPSAEDLASPLQALFCFLDHIINNLLGGFDVLGISPHPSVVVLSTWKGKLTLIMAETSPMSHILPSMDFSGCFSSSSLCGIFPWEVSFLLPSQHFDQTSEECGLHFFLSTPPGLDVIRLPNSQRSTGVDEGSVGITVTGSDDPNCQHCTSRSGLNLTYNSLCFFGADASVAATNRVPTQTA